MIKLELSESGVAVDILENEIRTQKYLSLASFRSGVMSGFKLDTGLLPSGTVAYQKAGTITKVAFIQQAGIQSVGFEKTEMINGEKKTIIRKFKVPFPLFLWIATLDIKNVINETKIYAVKDKLITMDTILYNAPFSNVYSAGRVCWGNDNILSVPLKTLVGLESLPGIFFSKTFNIDLDIPFHGGTLNFFTEFDGKDVFPLEDLVRNTTFKKEWQKK